MMSNALAIAAVTTTLRALIEKSLEPEGFGIPVTTQPLDKANDLNRNRKGINLFLYRTATNAAWSNMDLPRQVRPGETGFPPLALTLHYIVTAYGENDDNSHDHRLLGRAMSALHDSPLLTVAEIKAALPDSDLQNQIERVRITSQPLSIEEMSKLWAAFQAQFRVSATYEVSVVLIESSLPVRSPLPVLTQGPMDTGPFSQPDLTPPFPTLTDLVPDSGQISVRLGDKLILNGFHLDGDTVLVQFSNPRLASPLQVPPPAFLASSASSLTLKLPDTGDDPGASAKWPAGFYTVAAIIQRAGQPDRITNEQPLSLAPRITSPLPLSVARDGSGNAAITLDCKPEVLPEQRALLLVGDQQIQAQAHVSKTGTLTFIVPAAVPGKYFLRLRVDGVDSILIDRSVTPAVFDSTQVVNIT